MVPGFWELLVFGFSVCGVSVCDDFLFSDVSEVSGAWSFWLLGFQVLGGFRFRWVQVSGVPGFWCVSGFTFCV